MLELVLGQLLAVSVALNAFLAFRQRKKATAPPPSLELREFLADLASGAGVIRVTRLDPSDLMLRSPKGRA